MPAGLLLLLASEGKIILTGQGETSDSTVTTLRTHIPPQNTRPTKGDDTWLISLASIAQPLHKSGFSAGDLILLIL